jgi:phytoene dehydrogenase-like protein
MYDTVIIGAGMSGLAAGIRLAYYDRSVCILERHTTIGGLNSFYRQGGRNYDVGLHAVTNYTPKGTRKGPLARLLRQLRMQWEDFALAPQIGSEIAFPDVRMRFGNDFALLQSEVDRCFPNQKDNFKKLLDKIVDYDDLEQSLFNVTARPILRETITDPLLAEMILCPIMWYGNPRARDMDFGLFCIMFRSIFLEGFARPYAGVRLILKTLVKKFRNLGGELKLRTGVERINVENGRASGVVLDDGQQLEARQILSSAGWVETMRMCDHAEMADADQAGNLSFVEAIAVLDRQPRELDHHRTTLFFNDSEKFHWEQPDDLCDVRTGVICSPNNFAYDDGASLDEGLIRITAQANFDRWNDLSAEDYQLAKLRCYDRVLQSGVRFMLDFRNHVIDTDMFTPTTIRRFTSHDNGAVYGSPRKKLDGETHLSNLFLCGTDQGFVGIIGAMFSGVAMANRCLRSLVA